MRGERKTTPPVAVQEGRNLAFPGLSRSPGMVRGVGNGEGGLVNSVLRVRMDAWHLPVVAAVKKQSS